jgi:anti-anti-sigma factor
MLSQSSFDRPFDKDIGSGGLTVTVQRPDEDTLVITPAGEADFHTVPSLWQVLIEATSVGRPRVIVDLDQLTFMDASALGVLVDARLRFAEAGGTLLVRCSSRLGTRLLTLVGLVSLLEVPES